LAKIRNAGAQPSWAGTTGLVLPRNDWLVCLKKRLVCKKKIKKVQYFAEKWSTETAATTADFAKNVLESLLFATKVQLKIWSSK
jgi:hypothetical protein